MDVIRHQAIAKNAKLMTGSLFSKQRKIAASLTVGMKDLLAVIPPLRDVVRCADRHHRINAESAHYPTARGTFGGRICAMLRPFGLRILSEGTKNSGATESRRLSAQGLRLGG